MKHWITLLGALSFLAIGVPAVAQEGEAAGDSVDAAAPETPDALADETPDALAPETPDTPATPAAPAHDWEFALQPTNNAPQAGGNVMVTEGDPENTFVLQVTALPLVDSLDQEGQDVGAYTVWIVPSKDKVPESTLAGVLTVAPEGAGSFEGSTDLDSFGIIVTATADGAPAQISGVPVLTGIPVEAPEETEVEAPAVETPAAEPAPEADPAPEAEPAPEADPAAEADPAPEAPEPIEEPVPPGR